MLMGPLTHKCRGEGKSEGHAIPHSESLDSNWVLLNLSQINKFYY